MDLPAYLLVIHTFVHAYTHIYRNEIIGILGIYLATQYIDMLQPQFKSVAELCFFMHKCIHDSDVHGK